MFRGNISNRESPILAFNIDNLLLTDKPLVQGFLDKLMFKVGSEKYQYLNRQPNLVFVNSMLTLWDKYDYSIYFITQHPFEKDIEELLTRLNVCYTRLVYVGDLQDLRRDVFNRYTYYFDTNDENISILSSSKAVQFNLLWEKVGKA